MQVPSLPGEISGFSSALIERLPVALMLIDENNRVMAANQAALSMLGKTRESAVGMLAGDVCPLLADLLANIPLHEEANRELECASILGGKRLGIYLAPLTDTRTGTRQRLALLRKMEIAGAPRPEEQGELVPGNIPVRLLFETILDSIRHGILVASLDGLPVYYNRMLLSLWEKPAAYLIESGAGWPVLFSRRLKNPERLIRLVQAAGEHPSAEIYDFLELLSGRVLECYSRPDRPVTDGPAVRVWSFEDITEQKRTEHELHYLSTHDGLTGLYNRAYFEMQLRQINAYPVFPVSMIMVDVDGLKRVNDRLGHPAGDQVLVQAAEVLKRACRTDDVVARLGGDEFGILLLRTDAQAAAKVQDRIQYLQTLNTIARPELPVSLSVGAATAIDRDELGDLFSRADEDMYRRRKRKRSVRLSARKYWGKRRRG